MQLYIHGSRSVEGVAGPVWCEDGRHLITRVIAGGLHACVGCLKWDAKRGTPELFPGAGAGTMLYYLHTYVCARLFSRGRIFVCG